MIIEKLVIQNFKKHRDLVADFTPGKNLITGNNYSGKSTILQALLVGLYGNAMAPGETKDLIHDDAKDFSVLLYLDNDFCIKRSSKNSSVVTPSGEVVVRTHTAVNKWCEEMLETDRKTFMRVFASEQGSPQALLAMEGAQLRNFIEQAIGFGELDKLTKKSNSEITNNAAGYNANEEILLEGDVVVEYRKKCEEYLVTEAQAEKTIEEAAQTIALLTEKVKQLDEEYGAQRAAKVLLEKYTQNVETYEGMLADLPVAVPVVDITDLRETLDRDTEVYWKLHDADKAYTAACKSFDELSEYLDDKTAALVTDLPEKVTADAELATLQQATVAVTKLGIQTKAMEDSLDSSVCPTCQQTLKGAGNTEQLVEALILKREESDAAVAVRVSALAAFEKASIAGKAYNKAFNLLEKGKAVIKDLEDQLAKFAEKRAHAEVNLPIAFTNGTLRTDLDTLSDSIEKLAKQNTASESVEERRSGIVTKLAGLVKPAPVVIDLEAISVELGRVNTELSTCNEQVTEGRVCLTGCKIKRKNLGDLLDKNKKVKQRMSEFHKNHTAYSAISVALQGARKKAIESAFIQTMGIASEFVKACTGGDISEVYLAESGIRYTENGRGRGTVSASGAQKTLIGLGMKLGLSQIVRSPFGALLLDEISSDMDPDVSTACLTVLGEYCEQAIIVSHTASDVADNVIQL